MRTRCVYPAPITTIDALRSVLVETDHPLEIQELRELCSRLQLPSSEWRRFLTYDPHRFSYQTVHESSHFEINVIGWRSGQFSSIHDHRDTACCVLVLDGVLTNIDYHVDSMDEVEETSRFELLPGEMLSRNNWEIHRCGNAQPHGVDLATLHMYSPPLRPLEERQYQE
ncbi:cysteine dioxygenase [Rhodopirellula baltica]|uniref:cysteine dioxygenase n=1 Tax=Rhodopirellula baltica TaxID=265606 RepID=UPI0009D9BE31